MHQMKMHKCVNKLDSSKTSQEAVLCNGKKGWRVYRSLDYLPIHRPLGLLVSQLLSTY